MSQVPGVVPRTGTAQLEKFPLAAWNSRRRQDLLELPGRTDPTIQGLTAAVEQEARKRPEVLQLFGSYAGELVNRTWRELKAPSI
jgi:hypothetical protein